jgi:hypothetical protein
LAAAALYLAVVLLLCVLGDNTGSGAAYIVLLLISFPSSVVVIGTLEFVVLGFAPFSDSPEIPAWLLWFAASTPNAVLVYLLTRGVLTHRSLRRPGSERTAP